LDAISLTTPPQVRVNLCVNAVEARLIVNVTAVPISAEALDTEKDDALGIVVNAREPLAVPVPI
jgi:hypothetical protein